MKTTQKNLPNNIIEITIEDTPKAYEQARKQAITNFGKKVQIKGFRKGANIPESLIIKEVGDAQIADTALDIYLRGIYPKVLSEVKSSPVAPGQVTKITSLDPLIIVIEIEVLPVVNLEMKEIKKISLKKTEVSLEKDEVEEAIKEIEKRFTHFHPAGGSSEDGFTSDSVIIASGDRVTIDTQGFETQGGAAIEETHVKSFPLIIGSGQFIPGFEEKLIGHKAGEVVEFDITFPADYHSEKFKGKKVFFMTTVFQVEKPHTPEWTPDFIEKLRGVKTDMAGFKEILGKEILGEKEGRAREADEKTLLESLQKSATLELGKAILQKEIDIIFSEQKTHMESQGFSMKLYLEHIKMGEDAYRTEVITPEAERRIRAELILKALKDEMKVEATDTEIQLEINGIIAQYQNEQVIERLKAKLVPGDTYYEDIKTRLAYRKVVDSFFTK